MYRIVFEIGVKEIIGYFANRSALLDVSDKV